MATPIKTRILLRTDTLANWESSELTLGKGEMAIATLDGNYVEVRVGDGTGTWNSANKLKVTANQISGLVETINTQISAVSKQYQIVANDNTPNSWKLQSAALSGGDWTDVSTFTVELSDYYTKDEVDGISAALSSGLLGTADDTSADYTIYGARAYAKDYTDEQIAALSIDGYAKLTDVATVSSTLSSDYVEKIGAVETLVGTVSAETLASADTNAAAMSAYALGQAEEYANEICTDISTTVAADYLTNSTFNAISNEIGLSAASASNQVVTKKDIADLAGAMHFKGAFASLAEITSAKPGDVVIIASTSKEYVYNAAEGDPYSVNNWVELGDEILYATKAEVATVSAELTSDIAGLTADVGYLSGQIDTTNATLNTVSSDYLKAEDKTELTGLISTTSAETLISANAYTDSEIAKLSIGDYALSTDVDALVAAVSADAITSANAYTDEKIDALSIENYALSADVNTLVETVSAATLTAAKDYTDEQISALSADRFALSADVDALVGTVSAETLVSANAYTDALCASLSATVETDYIKHGEVVDTDLSGFFILSCGGANLRADEPEAPLS